jgi:hypothetical protein
MISAAAASRLIKPPAAPGGGDVHRLLGSGVPYSAGVKASQRAWCGLPGEWEHYIVESKVGETYGTFAERAMQ